MNAISHSAPLLRAIVTVLERRRRARRVPAYALAPLLGIHRNTYSRMMESGALSLDVLLLAAEELETTAEKIIAEAREHLRHELHVLEVAAARSARKQKVAA